ncbi:response regulator [Jannaschia sp. Os4]|uniref:response regulator n=1 Tax=Jannaschia sp. Os4 TaxID=2807617 RepID=UPI0019393032|nr:response regulator [Jannaschia sp. Os4]MBM2577682.1 response regulator [Jannaschia sp. Os4]
MAKDGRMAGELDGMRVLVVEDEILVLMDLEAIFAGAGAAVTTAASLKDGLARVDEAFDVALLDVRLGDGEVFPLARELDRRGVRVVFHSGHARVNDLLSDFPSARALPKPALENQLIRAVADARA